MNLPMPLLVLCLLGGFSSVGRFRTPTFGGSIGPVLVRQFPRANKFPHKGRGVMAVGLESVFMDLGKVIAILSLPWFVRRRS